MRIVKSLAVIAALSATLPAMAQFRTEQRPDSIRIYIPDTLTLDLGENPVSLSLEDAMKIALSENIAVKVADMEIQRSEYAKKGAYAALFPQVDGSASYQRTIRKQVMYMDFDMSEMMGAFPGAGTGDGTGEGDGTDVDPSASGMGGMDTSGGIEVGRWNTYNAGVSAVMPLVNVQLWKSLKISGQDVELAVEKARSSRLDMVTQVEQAYYGVLFAKEAFNVYKDVYQNALANMEQVQMRYNAKKASDLDFVRAKTAVANAIPNVYNAQNSVILALWQLKAVMGIDLDKEIDVAGSLNDYSEHMFYDIHQHDSLDLSGNSSLRQLAIQAEQIAQTIKVQKAAYLPSLAGSFAYNMMAMTNDFVFRDYKWSPYSYAGLSLNIPIFSGGKRLNDVRQAKVQAAELDLQRINAERQLKIAIRQSLNTMETNMKSYLSANEAVEAAHKAYDIAFKSYNLGRSTLTDLNDAQLALTQARLSVSQAVYNFVVAKATLEQTIGADFLDESGNTVLDEQYMTK